MEKSTPSSSTKMVYQETSLKIRELEDLSDLKRTLIAISYLLGVKEAPEAHILFQMIVVIKEEFNFFTIKEISQAVKKALSGKLRINGKILEIETYNNFSIPYICKILAAYKEYLINEGKLLSKTQENPDKMSQERIDELKSKWLNNVVYPQLENYFKKGNYNIPDYGNSLYNYLNEKFMNFPKAKSKEIICEARKQLLIELNNQLKRSGIERIKYLIADLISKKQATEPRVITRAKKIGLKMFLIQCAVENKDLVAEIKEYEDEVYHLRR